jgi:hypothetical protein
LNYHRQNGGPIVFAGASWIEGEAYGVGVCGGFSGKNNSGGLDYDYVSRLSKN